MRAIMVRISTTSHQYRLCFLTGLAIGIIVGVAAITIFVSSKIDHYLQQISALESVIKEKNIQLEKLEDVVNTRRYVLKKIEVFLVHEGDEMDKIALQKHIKQKYMLLIGKNLAEIDADMALEVIDQRIMQLGIKQYKLQVKKLVISEILKIWVETKAVKSS